MSRHPGGVQRARTDVSAARGRRAGLTPLQGVTGRAVLAAALALGWALLPSGPAGASGAPAPAATGPTALPVRIEVEQLTPQALAPGQDLTVGLRLTNVGTTTLEQPRVIVRLARSTFISRTSLDRWRTAPDSADAGISVLELDLPGPLPAGAVAQATAVVPASATGLRPTATSWGARALAVEVVDAADRARVRRGLVRTFTVWLPPQEVVPTTVTVLVPITGPPPGPSAEAELAALTTNDGRLGRVLRATAGTAVTWAVDPSLLGTGEAPRADDVGSAVDGLTRWQADLVAGAPADVQLLPYGDADVTALAHASSGELLATAAARSAQAADAVGLRAETRLLWPGDTVPDLVTAAVAGRQGAVLVAGPGALTPPTILTYTPSGRTVVRTAAGEVPVVVADERLSTALTSGRVRATGADGSAEAAPDDPQLTGAVAAADLLAEIAVITRERPSDGRHLLLTVPRDWTPDPEVTAAQLAALSAVPWVSTAPISRLVGEADTGVDRGTLPDRRSDPTEVSANQLEAVATALRQRTEIAEMATDPDALVGDPAAELLAPTALAWRADTAGRDAVIAASVAATEALRSMVSVQRGSDVTFVATSGSLPVRVVNALGQDVVVQVRLRPGSPQLVADEPVTITVPAGGEVTAQLPVHAIQSADVTVAVELRTATGVLIDGSAEFVVRVRADWESIGTGVVGALLAIGVVIGLFRTIRRGRGRRGTPQADLGPDDLSPEQAVAEQAVAEQAVAERESAP